VSNLGAYHAGLFPRQGDRGLLLSRSDELVLRQLSREWVTPARIYVQASSDAPELAVWLSHTGDIYLSERLLAWSRHTRGKLVEQQRVHRSPSPMIRWAFRWHAGAETILDTLPYPSTAPRVEVGGAVAYDPRHPWVCRVDAAASPEGSQGISVARSRQS
jgi:hypothetical protein